MQKPFDIKGIRFGEGRPVVCIPVVARGHAEIVEKIRELVSAKVQMIEWRADCFDFFDQPDEVRAILEEIRPIVSDTVMLFTLRTKPQGGLADIGEKKILYLDEIAAKSGSIDLIDLEYFELSRPEREINRLRQMGVRVISSHHDFERTPEDVIMRKVMDLMHQSGADIAKLAVMPDSADDLIRLLRLTNDTKQKYPDMPIVTIAMGSIGVVSRVTGEVFGSCITFGACGEGSAPGQLQADRLTDVLDALHEGLSAGNGIRKEHIFLIGFMGTGKTKVSGKLAEMLGMKKIELDEEITRESGMSIAEMFNRFGEDYFRERETAVLRNAASGEPAVVSCGGGCVLREENVSVLKDSGFIVLLTAEPETVYERVKDGTERPLLSGHMDVDYIAALMEGRRAAYEAASDLIVSTDGKNPGEVADEIRSYL